MAQDTQRKRRKVVPSEPTKLVPREHADLDLSNLTFEKKNENQKRLPLNTTIQRRPIQHAPIGNPYAGASVQKVVYVSRTTPIMAAVKRVRKLLLQVEKRAMKNVKLVDGRGNDREKLSRIAEGSKKAREEKIYVKGTGMAMGQVLKVGQWFREKEKEMAVDVDVKTGSVIVVDDIVDLDVTLDDDPAITAATAQPAQVESSGEMDVDEEGKINEKDVLNEQGVGGTTKEPVTMDETSESIESQYHIRSDYSKEDRAASQEGSKGLSRRSRRRKRRPMYDKDDVPEARTRWVKMVEVTISLKG